MDNLPPQPCNLYAIFHLNLAFSSLADDQHSEVIKQCYWPLLKLIKTAKIPAGIELTAYTLECIQKQDALWIETFSQLLSEGKCELLASGDSQIIGPLIPADVNIQNLKLGLSSYESILDTKPSIAYINEQAFSQSLLDIYLENGINSVVLEWNNPFSFLPNWHSDDFNQPRCLKTAQGRTINVIWNNAVAFQKFQRFAHGELVLEDYMDWLKQVGASDCQAFCIYGNDTEIFDFRPGRYQTELPNEEKEWTRIESLFSAINSDKSFNWLTPSQTLEYRRELPVLEANIASHPIFVKKQAKYNITRWGLSGKNDLLLNTICYRELKKLRQASNPDHQEWRNLCRLWSSDLRTHLCQSRYQKLLGYCKQFSTQPSQHTTVHLKPATTSPVISIDQKRNKIHIHTKYIKATLNAYRGLAIESLAFEQHGFKPVCGTLSQGHFDHISYGVDFYSNHLVMERFRQRDRVTDLSKTPYQISEEKNTVVIQAKVETGFGPLNKWYRFSKDGLETGFAFETTVRPEASLRLGYITLLNCSQRAWFACHNGSTIREVFHPDHDFDHGTPVSSIVSANNALGATEGEVQLGNGDAAIQVQWDPSDCAALPMLSSKKIADKFLNRLWFSLIESDETLQSEGTLLPFKYRISPISPPTSDMTS